MLLYVMQVRRRISATATTVSTDATVRCTTRASRRRVRTTGTVATSQTRCTRAGVDRAFTASTVSCTTRAPTTRASMPPCATPSTDDSSATANPVITGQFCVFIMQCCLSLFSLCNAYIWCRLYLIFHGHVSGFMPSVADA